jgi:hypothetical protein
VNDKPASHPPHPEETPDYIDLWKYFEDRGYEVKQTMLRVITWIIGFATVALGYIMKECLVYRSGGLIIKNP